MRVFGRRLLWKLDRLHLRFLALRRFAKNFFMRSLTAFRAAADIFLAPTSNLTSSKRTG